MNYRNKQQGHYLMLSCLLGLIASFSCSSPLCTFNLNNTYVMDGFTGREINNQTIGVCPLLIKAVPIDSNRFPPKPVIDTLLRRRSDLSFVAIGSDQSWFNSKVSQQNKLQFFTMLYEGRMFDSPAFDTVWRAIGNDYLLVCSMRQGMSINTFNKILKKTVLLEAELWDCKTYEVVWRASVSGTSLHKELEDRRFIASAFGEIATALPVPLPSYDNSSW